MVEGRILHVVTDTDRRGAQSAALTLHEALSQRGWHSRIVALAPGRTGGLPIPTLGPSGLHPATARALRRRAGSADVVVAHGSTTLPACAAALLGSTPFIYVNIGDPRAWLTSRARLARTRAALRRAAAVAAISPQSAHVLTEWVGVPGPKVRVIPNSRDHTRFHPLAAQEKREARVQLGLPAASPLVAWLGSLTAEKGPDLAIEVARGLPGVTLAMAGGGPELDRLRPEAEAHGVRLLGPVAEPEALLGAADALLLTSDTEGVPGVLIEAGLCGIPAAATDVGFVADVVLDGVTGRLSPAGDAAALASAVAECLDNAPRWGPAARERCTAHFATETVLPQWESLLTQVAGR